MIDEQRRICKTFGAEFYSTPFELKLGISESALRNQVPLNGLRHPPEGDTSGWYVWGGEVYSEALDFFKPLCISHLKEKLPIIVKYLSLPPGWRFLIADGYDDVWFDESLLDI